jgi:nucleotide-binding universal stress UspA family protein
MFHRIMTTGFTHGRGGVNCMLLGSVTGRVIRVAPCAVLTVRRPDKAAAAE